MASSTIVTLGEIAAQRWGLFTTEQANASGVSRRTLSGLASSGVIIRLAQGVYRMVGAPEEDLEWVHVPWLALGGAVPRQRGTVAPVVVAGRTAALTHRIGDWFPGVREFIVPTRRSTRLVDVRLRTQRLDLSEVTVIDGLPVLTVERTIADLIGQWEDYSLVADALAQAVEQGKLTSPAALARHLEPISEAQGFSSGTELAINLAATSGVTLRAWS